MYLLRFELIIQDINLFQLEYFFKLLKTMKLHWKNILQIVILEVFAGFLQHQYLEPKMIHCLEICVIRFEDCFGGVHVQMLLHGSNYSFVRPSAVS